jgi:probable F420-dependent oxidoreductase
VALRFGAGFPTCREGTTYSVPYVEPGRLAEVARRAEALGYDSIWGNDHLTTPRAIRATQAQPPNFYEPLVTFAAMAGVTERLRFLLGVVVLPEREPVLLAKQVATLDMLSGGRVMLGLGIGSYREELEAVLPHLKDAHRGVLLDEGLQALRLLFDEPSASFEGRYLRFTNVELAPKPFQRPFPLYLSARGPAGLKRVARLADGWIIGSAQSPSALAASRQQLDAALVEQGRDPAAVETHYQIWLSFARDRAEAEARLKRSQHFRRMAEHNPQLSQADLIARFRTGSLQGTPDDVIEQVRAFEQAGVTHLGVVFLGDSMDELLADMELFAERVMPAFEARRE